MSPAPSPSPSPSPPSPEHSAWQKIRSFDPNWVIVFLTLALAWLANEDRKLNNKTIAHNIAVERAYVNMSHKPPGLYSLAGSTTPNPTAVPLAANEAIMVNVQVTNHGPTPATITAAVMTIEVGESLPDKPSYSDHKTWGAFFLMPNDGHFYTGRMIHTGIKEEDMARIQAGEGLFIWAIGYVDYTDVFGKRHRAGYARRYSPRSAENNLVFETKPGYNYDIDQA
jgi:hypothetical protein